MSTRDAKQLADSMLRDSPLLNFECTGEEVPEGDGSDKLPEGDGGEKLPAGGANKFPAASPTGKLVMPSKESFLVFALNIN
jgi:hypothetical protein